MHITMQVAMRTINRVLIPTMNQMFVKTVSGNVVNEGHRKQYLTVWYTVEPRNHGGYTWDHQVVS